MLPTGTTSSSHMHDTVQHHHQVLQRWKGSSCQPSQGWWLSVFCAHTILECYVCPRPSSHSSPRPSTAPSRLLSGRICEAAGASTRSVGRGLELAAAKEWLSLLAQMTAAVVDEEAQDLHARHPDPDRRRSLLHIHTLQAPCNSMDGIDGRDMRPS
ncbi:uncharacterized protein [Triticum aestivum]|uniref:uncharacterized protein n=1 Tax=Triticum aestivum TaxID=4565 RepID=UPI001D02FDB1|nr:uncharacterized protein LOC123059586 [Triticum aestivum]